MHRRWLLPAFVIIVWLVLAGAGGGYQQRLGEVVKNDNAAFLPAGAEATRVAADERRFLGAEQVPAVIVYERATGITAADRAAVAADVEFLRSVAGVAGEVTGPLPAADGKALELVVPLSGTGDATVLPGAVRTIRERVQGPATPAGLTAHVTGPGGMAGDLGEIFSGADVRLLVIASLAVFLILMLVYRSVLLPFVVLISAQLAQTLASVAVYLLAEHDVIKLNGQSQGALVLICLGTATDYALLLVGRYREELAVRPSKYEAMGVALRASVPTILASGVTVILAMLCLLLSELSSNRGYGPVFALGITAALLATFTVLPAILVLLGRAAFWPYRKPARHLIWRKVAGVIGRGPRRVWVGAAVVLFALAAFVPTFKAESVPMSEQFLTKPDSVIGLDVLSRHFPGGSGAPAIVVGPATERDALVAAARGVAGVDSVVPLDRVVDGDVLLQVTLRDPADSTRAEATVRSLRVAVHAVTAGARVGGPTAIAIDTASAGRADLRLVMPLALLVVLVLLVVLLRALVAPLLLIATVILSAAATLGIAAILFNHVLDLAAADPSLPLFCLVFLIAVGVDYNIFLMARVKEESAAPGGTRPGVLRGLTTTGGVISSAGIVLGATFSLFAILPFLPLVQIAVIIVVGVLLDTFVVRALLVPALAYDVGRRIWWPSRWPPRAAQDDPASPAEERRVTTG
jgi:RND superfamily putative drug exporter